MEEIKRLNWLHKLKEVERKNKIKERYENPAEHSWSAMMLATYFMPKGLDELKVFKMLLYHDLIEIEVGDVFAFDFRARKLQEAKEWKAYEKLCKELPGNFRTEFKTLWKEFEEMKSPEAKFAKACDKLDPLVQTAFEKSHFEENQISEAMIRESKEQVFREFPELNEFFEKLMNHLRKKKYFFQG